MNPNMFYIAVLVVISVLFLVGLLRMVKGPSVADRLLASGVMGSLCICSICVLGLYLNESFLIDIALVYALISFLAVVILSQIYIGLYREKKAKRKKSDGGEEK